MFWRRCGWLASATALSLYGCVSLTYVTLRVFSVSSSLCLRPPLLLSFSLSLRLFPARAPAPSASVSPSASLLLALALPLPLACAAERGGAGAGGDDGGADRGEGFWDDLRKCGLWW